MVTSITIDNNEYLEKYENDCQGAKVATVERNGHTYTHYCFDKKLDGFTRFRKGFIALIGTVSLIGLAIFFKEIKNLWKESVNGLEKWNIYVLDKKSSTKKQWKDNEFHIEKKNIHQIFCFHFNQRMTIFLEITRFL